jgi:hypothetical protein
VELNDKDPGVHYQLFLAYSRLRRKDEADKELAEFKRLDEVNRHGATPLMGTKDGETFAALAGSGGWRQREATHAKQLKNISRKAAKGAKTQREQRRINDFEQPLLPLRLCSLCGFA